MAQPRSLVVDPDRSGIYHCTSRCVRRERLLASPDRREWILRRLELLVQYLAVDVICFAILPNHLHVLVRTLPERARSLSDRQVAVCRLSLLPNIRLRKQLGLSAEDPPCEAEIQSFLSNPLAVRRARQDLSSLGFFHKMLKEPCARRWNLEDSVTGHFWEGRYRSPRVLDSEAVLRVARYIELNEIRACLADSIPASLWSSVCAQWMRLWRAVHDAAQLSADTLTEALSELRWEPVLPCGIPEAPEHALGTSIPSMPLAAYLAEVDALGRVPRAGRPGFIRSTVVAFEEAIAGAAGQLAAGVRSLLHGGGSTLARRWNEAGGLGPANREDPMCMRPCTGVGSCYGSRAACRAEAVRRGVRNTVAIELSG